MKSFEEWVVLREQGMPSGAPAAPAPTTGDAQQAAVNQAVTGVTSKPLSDINAWFPPALQAQYVMPKDSGQQVGLFTTQLNNYLRHIKAQPAQNLMTGNVVVIGSGQNFEFELTKQDTQEKRRFKPFDQNALVEAGDWLTGKEEEEEQQQ